MLPLEASAIVEPLRSVLAIGRFVGTATDLLAELDEQATETVARRKEWPKNARALSNELRRIRQNLESNGVLVTFPARSAKQRTITAELVNHEHIEEMQELLQAEQTHLVGSFQPPQRCRGGYPR